MLIGVISDTHGLIRQKALDALAGSELIIHAGDIGRPAVLDSLKAIAPVVAVRGNVDHDAWTRELPLSQFVEAGGGRLFVIHDVHQVDFDPAERDVKVVISGHSHNPLIEERNGVIYLNPGSAGPKRFKLPVSLALLTAENGGFQARLVDLS